MKKGTKIVVIALILLFAIAVPLYSYLRPKATQEWAIEVRGLVMNPANITLSELKAIPSLTVTATLRSSHEPSGNYSYRGVPLRRLLEQVGVFKEATSVYVRSIDLYGASFSIEEAMQNEQIMLAYERNGEPLKTREEGGEGPVRLIVATDEFAQRWVKNVVLIEVS